MTIFHRTKLIKLRVFFSFNKVILKRSLLKLLVCDKVHEERVCTLNDTRELDFDASICDGREMNERKRKLSLIVSLRNAG